MDFGGLPPVRRRRESTLFRVRSDRADVDRLPFPSADVGERLVRIGSRRGVVGLGCQTCPYKTGSPGHEHKAPFLSFSSEARPCRRRPGHHTPLAALGHCSAWRRESSNRAITPVPALSVMNSTGSRHPRSPDAVIQPPRPCLGPACRARRGAGRAPHTPPGCCLDVPSALDARRHAVDFLVDHARPLNASRSLAAHVSTGSVPLPRRHYEGSVSSGDSTRTPTSLCLALQASRIWGLVRNLLRGRRARGLPGIYRQRGLVHLEQRQRVGCSVWHAGPTPTRRALMSRFAPLGFSTCTRARPSNIRTLYFRLVGI